ncbi:MAG: uracil phosphoribosyltransferase [Bacteroidaceae bacterium]|nr:uracil phosphoribosyltransferase [Bacteroidaceae bacterium]
MKVVNLSNQNTILTQFLAEIRDVNIQQERLRFRHNILRIGHVMAYETSKYLNYSVKSIETPLQKAEVATPDDSIVLGTVFRAGLPFHQGFLDVFDKAGNAFVSAYRYYKDKDCSEVGVKIEYIASPDLNGKTLIIVDPMLATGESMEMAYNALLTKGTPSKVIFASIIASKQGVQHLQKVFPSNDIVLLCAAIDPILNEREYIVPGLGDAGDLMYGDKL